MKTIYLSFVWSLLEPHPSKSVEETSKKRRSKSHTVAAIFVCWPCPTCILCPGPCFESVMGSAHRVGSFEQLLVAHHVSSQFYTNCTWHISRSTYVCTYIHIYMFISTLIIATQLIMHVCLLLIKSQHTGNSKLID